MSKDTQKQIEKASEILRFGGIVAMPTETVYGLCARADDFLAIEKIFKAKNRPAINPLICHMTDLEMAKKYVKFSPLAEKLAQTFWPGALTLVLPKTSAKIAANVSAGLETLAVRVPANAIFRETIKTLNIPLAAPSANSSGKLSPTTAKHVEKDLGTRVDMIIDGGATEFGLESTIVMVTENEAILLRHGAIAREDIEAILNQKLKTQTHSEKPLSPGQMLRHYAPRTAIKLNATKDDATGKNDFWIGFGDQSRYDLSPNQNLKEAAHNLFAQLAKIDSIANENSIIYIAPIPNEGIGEAINDRLQRAAETTTKRP